MKKMSSRRIAQIILVGVVIVILILLAKAGSGSPSGVEGDPRDVRADDWVKGGATAAVTIMEYADFQCPACRTYDAWLQKIVDEDFSGKVRLVYRYFPLPSHKNARVAAHAAEAAGRQGKFWPMHDTLFSEQQEWQDLSNPREKFVEYAKKFNLNIDQFSKDMNDGAVADRVERDYYSGEQMRVDATPTLFINGVKAESPGNYESLKKLIATVVESGVR